MTSLYRFINLSIWLILLILYTYCMLCVCVCVFARLMLDFYFIHHLSSSCKRALLAYLYIIYINVSAMCVRCVYELVCVYVYNCVWACYKYTYMHILALYEMIFEISTCVLHLFLFLSVYFTLSLTLHVKCCFCFFFFFFIFHFFLL